MRTIASFTPIERGGTARQMARGIWHLYWCNPTLRFIGIAMLMLMGGLFMGMLSTFNYAPGDSTDSPFQSSLAFSMYQALFVGLQFGGPFLVAMRSERRSTVMLPLSATQRRLVLWLACVVVPAGVIFLCLMILQVLFAAAISDHPGLAANSAYTALLLLGLRALAFQITERAPNVTGWEVLRGMGSWHLLPGVVLVLALIAAWYGGYTFEALPILAAFSVAIALWAFFVKPNEHTNGGTQVSNAAARRFQDTQRWELARFGLLALGLGAATAAIVAPSYFLSGLKTTDLLGPPIVVSMMLGGMLVTRLRALRPLPLSTNALSTAFLLLAALAALLPAAALALLAEPESEYYLRLFKVEQDELHEHTDQFTLTPVDRSLAFAAVFVLVFFAFATGAWQQVYGLPIVMLILLGTMRINFVGIHLRWDPNSIEYSLAYLAFGVPALLFTIWIARKSLLWRSALYRPLQANGYARPTFRAPEPDVISRYVLPVLLVLIIASFIVPFARPDSTSDTYLEDETPCEEVSPVDTPTPSEWTT